jgi:hypothetical protein
MTIKELEAMQAGATTHQTLFQKRIIDDLIMILKLSGHKSTQELNQAVVTAIIQAAIKAV